MDLSYTRADTVLKRDTSNLEISEDYSFSVNETLTRAQRIATAQKPWIGRAGYNSLSIYYKWKDIEGIMGESAHLIPSSVDEWAWPRED